MFCQNCVICPSIRKDPPHTQVLGFDQTQSRLKEDKADMMIHVNIVANQIYENCFTVRYTWYAWYFKLFVYFVYFK